MQFDLSLVNDEDGELCRHFVNCNGKAVQVSRPRKPTILNVTFDFINVSQNQYFQAYAESAFKSNLMNSARVA